MLSYFRSSRNRAEASIGIDCGSRVLNAVQVSPRGGGFEVVAAAAAPFPSEALADPAALTRYFRGTVRPLIASNGFRGRRVALAVPAHQMHVSSFRAAGDSGATHGGVDFWEGPPNWLPFPESQALIRNIDAGEVYEGGRARREVVTLAVRREVVDRYAAAACAAGLEVASVASEPCALLAALSLQGADSRLMRLVVDLGLSSTRVYAAVGRRLVFARSLRTGGAHVERAVAASLGVGREEACSLRTALPSLEQGATVSDERLRRVDEACTHAVEKLVSEIRHCHHYVSSAFGRTPVHHIVFVGGGARHRRLWQRIASGVGLPARAADPMSRMAPARGAGSPAAGPGWAVAAGLSIAASQHDGSVPGGPVDLGMDDYAISRVPVPV